LLIKTEAENANPIKAARPPPMPANTTAPECGQKCDKYDLNGGPNKANRTLMPGRMVPIIRFN
jgi:hypothetical protein